MVKQDITWTRNDVVVRVADLAWHLFLDRNRDTKIHGEVEVTGVARRAKRQRRHLARVVARQDFSGL